MSRQLREHSTWRRKSTGGLVRTLALGTIKEEGRTCKASAPSIEPVTSRPTCGELWKLCSVALSKRTKTSAFVRSKATCSRKPQLEKLVTKLFAGSSIALTEPHVRPMAYRKQRSTLRLMKLPTTLDDAVD